MTVTELETESRGDELNYKQVTFRYPRYHVEAHEFEKVLKTNWRIGVLEKEEKLSQVWKYVLVNIVDKTFHGAKCVENKSTLESIVM